MTFSGVSYTGSTTYNVDVFSRDGEQYQTCAEYKPSKAMHKYYVSNILRYPGSWFTVRDAANFIYLDLQIQAFCSKTCKRLIGRPDESAIVQHM